MPIPAIASGPRCSRPASHRYDMSQASSPSCLILASASPIFPNPMPGGFDQISRQSFDVLGFRTKIETFRPMTVAFTSKKAASLFYDRPTSAISLGRQPLMGGFPEAFVL